MDALDIQNAIMSGAARYNEWRTKFLEQWQESLMLGKVSMMFSVLLPELKEAMKKADPDGYEKLTDALKQKGGRYGK